MSIKKQMARGQMSFFTKMAQDDEIAGQITALKSQFAKAKTPKAKQRVLRILSIYLAEASRRGIALNNLSFVVMTDEETGIKHRIPVH
jgi:hypothetical protein